MISSVSEVLAIFGSALWSRLDLLLEQLTLWHQVMVMQACMGVSGSGAKTGMGATLVGV